MNNDNTIYYLVAGLASLLVMKARHIICLPFKSDIPYGGENLTAAICIITSFGLVGDNEISQKPLNFIFKIRRRWKQHVSQKRGFDYTV